MYNRNYRNRETNALRIAVIALAAALWLILYPAVIRSAVLNERTENRDSLFYMNPLVIEAHLIYDCAELSSYAFEELPHYFYRTRRVVRRICDKLREFMPFLPDDDVAPVIYEENAEWNEYAFLGCCIGTLTIVTE